MDKQDTLRKIDEMFDYGSKLAIELIESEARKILASNPELDEFVMAMGGRFFTCKNGLDSIFRNYDNIVRNYNFEGQEYFPEFFKMVDDLNERFNVCGHPMRFTASGQIVKDW